MTPPVSLFACHYLAVRRRSFGLLLLLTLAWPSPCSHAQAFDATPLRQPTDLATGWLIHAGDDPAYAQAAFDDSHWTPFNAQTQDLRALFSNGRPEIVWYRLHVKVAADQTDLAMLESGISEAFDVYLNGAPLLGVGRVSPFVAYDSNSRFLLPVPRRYLATGNFVLALRVRITPAEWNLPGPGYYSTNLTLGPESVLREHMWVQIIGEHALPWLKNLLRLAMCIGALLLFLTQRERDEYLWLCLLVLCEVPNMIVGLFSLTHPCPESWLRVCDFVSLPYIYFFVRMYCSFVGHKVGWRLQVYTLASCICFGYLYTGDLFSPSNSFLSLIAYTPFVVLSVILLPAIMIRHIWRGKHVESVLLIPVLIADFGFIVQWWSQAANLIPSLQGKATGLVNSMLFVQAGPFAVDLFNAVEILELASLALIILIRSNRISRQQSIFESEIANAREVQRVILPESIEPITGFRIESVYLPAREVSGDFFQILPAGKDGLLLVLGDVAGKGLPAALLVSVLVGSIRSVSEFCKEPDGILAHLNERMMGRTKGGFSTALVALFSADGTVAIANAGHLSPFIDGTEVDLPGALPLGIVAGACYDITRVQMQPGSGIMFCSDGVVEAQSKQGQLFGFERTREISTQPASAIAHTAMTFGQEDDITVIRIERIAGADQQESEQSTPAIASIQMLPIS